MSPELSLDCTSRICSQSYRQTTRDNARNQNRVRWPAPGAGRRLGPRSADRGITIVRGKRVQTESFCGIHHYSRVSSRCGRWQLCRGHPRRVRHRPLDRLGSLRLQTNWQTRVNRRGRESPLAHEHERGKLVESASARSRPCLDRHGAADQSGDVGVNNPSAGTRSGRPRRSRLLANVAIRPSWAGRSAGGKAAGGSTLSG
jgi:hypothetical protein